MMTTYLMTCVPHTSGLKFEMVQYRPNISAIPPEYGVIRLLFIRYILQAALKYLKGCEACHRSWFAITFNYYYLYSSPIVIVQRYEDYGGNFCISVAIMNVVL